MDELLYELMKSFAGTAASTLEQQAATAALQALGLGFADSESAFQTSVENSLKTIAGEIGQLGTALAALGAADARISEQISDAELQSLLTAYTTSVSTINEYFQIYALASANLGNASMRDASIQQLYSFLSSPAFAAAVATEMRNINTFVNGTGELTNLIAYQQPHAYASFTAYVASPGNWVHQVNGLANFPDNALLYQTFLDAVSANGSIEQSLLDDVIPALKNALLAQTRGLAFLRAAWGGGPQQAQLDEFNGNIVAQAKAMQTAFAAMTAFDSYVSGAMAQHAVALSQDDLRNFFGGNVQGWPGIWWSAVIPDSNDEGQALQPGYFFNMPGTPFNLMAQVLQGPQLRFYGNFVAITRGSEFPDYRVDSNPLHVVVSPMPSAVVSAALSQAITDFDAVLTALIQAAPAGAPLVAQDCSSRETQPVPA